MDLRCVRASVTKSFRHLLQGRKGWASVQEGKKRLEKEKAEKCKGTLFQPAALLSETHQLNQGNVGGLGCNPNPKNMEKSD